MYISTVKWGHGFFAVSSKSPPKFSRRLPQARATGTYLLIRDFLCMYIFLHDLILMHTIKYNCKKAFFKNNDANVIEKV